MLDGNFVAVLGLAQDRLLELLLRELLLLLFWILVAELERREFSRDRGVGVLLLGHFYCFDFEKEFLLFYLKLMKLDLKKYLKIVKK